MDANAAAILAEQLTVRGPSVMSHDGAAISTRNPLRPGRVEVVVTRDGCCVTAWGYELGESGEEIGTAARLTFLLGAPTSLVTQEQRVITLQLAEVHTVVERTPLLQPAPQGDQHDADLKHTTDQLLAKVQAHLAKIQRESPR